MYIMDPFGNKHQLDYIVVNRKWKSSIMNCEAYSTFSSVGSDHMMVSLHIRLSFSARKSSPTKKPKYDWQTLKLSTELQDQNTSVRNKFQTLQNEDESPTDRYEKFTEADNSAMAELLPVKQRVKGAPKAKHPDVIAAREKLPKASNQFNNNPTEKNQN